MATYYILCATNFIYKTNIQYHMRIKILHTIVVLAILTLMVLTSCNITGNAIKDGTPEFDAALNAKIDECNQKGRSLAGSECFQDAAFEFNRPALCNLAGTYKNHCYTFVASKTSRKKQGICFEQRKHINKRYDYYI